MSTKKFFFDLETTGVNFWQNGIHQIAAIIEIDGEIVEELDLKVQPNPRAKIEQTALDVGNVTLDQILEYPDMRDVYQDLLKTLGKYVQKFKKQDKFHLVGFNNRQFDDQFLRAWFKQNNDKYFGSWFWSDSQDVMILASRDLEERRSEMKNFKLMTVAREYGIEVDDEKLHDGLYDVRITREIYKLI
jgi:DNA polymerase-3 subunit epsilon